jgi:hypothetical protein
MAAQILIRKTIKRLLKLLLLLIVFSPVIMLLAWLVAKKRKLVLAIVDKTVLTRKGQEHISLDWVLNQEKFAKSNNQLYKKGEDYFGFFPGENENFSLKGLERFSTSQLDLLTADIDVAYFTDTYGIFKNEWYKEGDAKERSGTVYGGMSRQDIELLKKMQAKHKLIITEFNCLASPTQPAIRDEFERMFGVKWTGWTGRYFQSFDTAVNKELPHWLISNYTTQNNGKWPFTKSGIALVHEDGRIVILENKTHLRKELPFIYSTEEGQEHYGLPEKIKYAFWFDIIEPDTAFNHLLASFEIDTNEAGAEELRKNNIPASFPAVTTHINDDYRFFYLSADFSDNPVELGSSYLKHVKYLSWFMYNTSDPVERKSFFWKVYRPLVTTILNDYYYSIHPDH